MIINIPLHIDDELMEEKLANEARIQVVKDLTNRVDDILTQTNYYAKDGLTAMIYKVIDKCIAENKDQIIELAAEKLAERLARTKAAKETIK